VREIAIDVWGDFACFSRPESKVERLTYPVPTPSAMRGLLSAIYSKPREFYWQVNRIEVLRPLKYISFKRNEVKEKLLLRADGAPRNDTPILVDYAGEDKNKGHTQRQTVALRDVSYRVYASICRQADYTEPEERLYNQALRRISRGQCFYQPSLGLREFAAYFQPAEGSCEPIQLDLDLGWMLYDVFDLHKWQVTSKTEPYVTLFHARLQQGVLQVPPFDSPDVLRPEVI
jgi:CRISPR-associated protein Cas5d